MALNLSYHDGISPVDLVNHIMYHDASFVVLQLSSLEISKRFLYSTSTIVFAFAIISLSYSFIVRDEQRLISYLVKPDVD